MLNSIKLNKNLLKGSFVLLVAFNIYNVLNFFFQFSMARLLDVAAYGILASLFSFIYISNIFSDSVQTIITKYSSNESKLGKLKNLANKSLRKTFLISLVLLLLYAAVSIPLSPIIKIPYTLLLLTGLAIFFAFMLPVTRGIMQGRKKFKSLGFNLIIESGIKLVLSILLVVLGWNVYGAMAATIIAFIIAFLFSFALLKDIFSSKEEHLDTTGIYQYSLPVIIFLFIVTIFYSIDVIIAKIVFDATTAGFYAISSILAKTIFWATQPISRAMFSFSSEEKNEKSNKRHLLFNALGILFVILAMALVIFYFFPDLLIKIFSGKSAPQSVEILFYVGLANAIISIVNLLLLYKLSISTAKNSFIFLIFPIIEVVILWTFSANLVQFSIAYIASSIIFLFGSILFLKLTK